MRTSICMYTSGGLLNINACVWKYVEKSGNLTRRGLEIVHPVCVHDSFVVCL